MSEKTSRSGTHLLRVSNDSAVFAALSQQRALSRADIAIKTGLSKPTVLEVIGRLVQLGLVVDVGQAEPTKPGPRARLYRVQQNLGYGAGIELRGHTLSVQVQDISGRTLSLFDKDLPKKREAELDDVLQVLRQATAASGITLAELGAVVIGTVGGVDPQTGQLYAWDLPHWRYDLNDGLAAHIGGNVTIDNEVNLRTLAEHELGNAQDFDTFVLLALGQGIGAGIMVNRLVHRGASGMAGELGFLPRSADDFIDLRHGTGKALNLQDSLGAAAVLSLAEDHRLPASSAAEAVRLAVSHPDRTGCDAFLTKLANRVAFAAATALTLLDPEGIVLAGDLGVAGGPELAQRVSQRLHGLLGPVGAPCPAVRTSTLEQRPVLTGAMSLSRRILRDRALHQSGYSNLARPPLHRSVNF